MDTKRRVKRGFKDEKDATPTAVYSGAQELFNGSSSSFDTQSNIVYFFLIIMSLLLYSDGFTEASLSSIPASLLLNTEVSRHE